MAELGLLPELSDENREELDKIEKSTPDVERQIRAATTAVEDEEAEQQTRAAEHPDAEMRERIALRAKASLTNYLQAALSGRQVAGPEAELAQAAGVNGIPLELWDVPESRTEKRVDAATGAPGTVGINLRSYSSTSCFRKLHCYEIRALKCRELNLARMQVPLFQHHYQLRPKARALHRKPRRQLLRFQA